MAVQLQVGVGRRGPVGQHHVKPVQCQVAQQVFKSVFVAQQPQARRLHHRLHQAAHRQLRQTVRDADCQAHGGRADGIADHCRQLVTELKNLLGLSHGSQARVCQAQTAPGWFEQSVAQCAFELAHLRANGLYRHSQPLGRPRHAAFFGDNPEVVKVAVVEFRIHLQFFQKY